MKKKYYFDGLFEGNLFIVFCVIFSMVTLVQLFMNMVFGVSTDLSAIALQMAAYTGAPIFALSFPRHLFAKNYISEKTFDFLNSIFAHYIVSCILLMPYAAMLRVFTDASRNIYLETVILFTAGYIVIHIGAMIVTFVQIQKANRNLKKIHASRKD